MGWEAIWFGLLLLDSAEVASRCRGEPALNGRSAAAALPIAAYWAMLKSTVLSSAS